MRSEVKELRNGFELRVSTLTCKEFRSHHSHPYKKKKNYKTEIQQLLETCKRTEVSGQTTPAKFRETGTSGEIQQL